jgi:four helix bundle protein
MKFEDLETWQEARALVNRVYQITRDESLRKDFGLCSQIQRASVSVMSNVAEGFERAGKAEKLNFYNIARASCGEVRSLLYVIEDNYTNQTDSATMLRRDAESVGRLVSGLMASTRRRTIIKASLVIMSIALPASLIALIPVA